MCMYKKSDENERAEKGGLQMKSCVSSLKTRGESVRQTVDVSSPCIRRLTAPSSSSSPSGTNRGRARTAKGGPPRECVKHKVRKRGEGGGGGEMSHRESRQTFQRLFLFVPSRCVRLFHVAPCFVPSPLASPLAFQLRSHQRCARYIRSGKFFLQHG